MNEKPLFIPLMSIHYDAFFQGMKKHEFRKYGARWNEKTCRIGRLATLSKGYGKKNRVAGIVVSFERIPATDLNRDNKVALLQIYGSIDFDVAKIGIENHVGRGLIRKCLDWKEYPVGTKAHACSGGAWLKIANGRWQWNGQGGIFTTPGADAFGKCIELPGANL